MKAPTHSEVAKILRGVDLTLADFVERNLKHCWADLLILVQRNFHPSVVASAIRVLDANDMGAFVRHAWCPATKELLDRYLKLDSSETVKRGIFGSVWVMRFVWQRVRRDWMRRQGLRSVADDAFIGAVVLWLELEAISHA